MKILLMNPNSQASMIHKAASAALNAARPETEIIAVISRNDPPCVERFLDVAMC